LQVLINIIIHVTNDLIYILIIKELKEEKLKVFKANNVTEKKKSRLKYDIIKDIMR